MSGSLFLFQYVYLSLSLHLFLPDDKTALTCPLTASYLGYLRKYPRLPNASQEVEILNVLMLDPLESLPPVPIQYLCNLCHLLCFTLSVTCHGGEVSIAGKDVLYSQLLQSAPQVNLLLHLEPEQFSQCKTDKCHMFMFIYV